MTLRDKFQEWLERADFEDIIMVGFVTITTAIIALITLLATIAAILTA